MTRFPYTKDVLRRIYPDYRIRELFEELFSWPAHNREHYSCDFETLDALGTLAQAKELGDLIRESKKDRKNLFAHAGKAIRWHAMKMAQMAVSDVETTDHVEYLFACASDLHNWRRRILVPLDEARAPKKVLVHRHNILYSEGDEILEKGKLHCGDCGNRTPGNELSRIKILREDMNADRKQRIIRQMLTAAFRKVGRRSRVTKAAFQDAFYRAVDRQFPIQDRGQMDWDDLYLVLENVSRKNIPADAIAQGLARAHKEAVIEAIGDYLPVPLAVQRFRTKANARLVKKLMMYLHREKIYKVTDAYGPRKNPIHAPIDLYGIRAVFGTERECYELEERLSEDPRFRLHELYRKDRIRRPKKDGYQTLQLAAYFSSEGLMIPLEIQVRTHRMDAASEYSDPKQAHKVQEDRTWNLARNVCPPLTDFVLYSLLAPRVFENIRHKMKANGADYPGTNFFSEWKKL